MKRYSIFVILAASIIMCACDGNKKKSDDASSVIVKPIDEIPGIFEAHGTIGSGTSMNMIEFINEDRSPAPQIARQVQLASEQRDLLTLTCSPYQNVVRIVPALNVTSEEIIEGASRLSSAIHDVLSEKNEGV